MSSNPHPTTSSFLRSSVGSISTNRHLHHSYTDSPWIRRLHPGASPLSLRQSTSIRDHSRSTIGPISTYESRTPLKLPQAQSDQQESGEVVSGFGPYQFKATSRVLSKHFPDLVARIARFSSDKRFADGRRKAFKLSPLFQFMPPLQTSRSRFIVQNFSQGMFPVKAEYLAEADFHGEASEAATNISIKIPESLNLVNQEDEPFSYWKLGSVNRDEAISSFASVPSLENLPRKRFKVWSQI